MTILHDDRLMACTTKRHPSRTRLRTAFDAQGHLLALESDFVLDGGAYATRGLTLVLGADGGGIITSFASAR